MFVSDRTRIEIGHIKVDPSPQRWRFRSSTSVWGHIRCFQWDCECVPPGPSIVISERRLRHIHLHTVTRLHGEVCRRSAVSFRRRINITAIFLNRHLFFGRMVNPSWRNQNNLPTRRWARTWRKEEINEIWSNSVPFTDQCVSLCCRCRRCFCGGGYGSCEASFLNSTSEFFFCRRPLQHLLTAESVFPDASASLSCRLLLIALSYV